MYSLLLSYNLLLEQVIIYTAMFVKQWGETAIYRASAEGHTETVKVLLQEKADTEIQDMVTAG